ncbi:MAG: PAS domain S-box protein [Candidatus Marinimicrobia bacterium]|nr:PAS domain S-box protein [Candidatus Neomarinimicrobiota bacterium]
MRARINPVLHRAAYQVATALTLILIFLVFGGSDWVGDKQIHTLMEISATLLAFMAGTVALIGYYARKNNMILFVGTAMLGAAFLDGYHTIVTSTFFDAYFPSPPPSLIPWSWNASRTLLSILMLGSLVAWRREQRLGAAGRIKEQSIYLAVGGLTLASFLFFAFVPLPRAYYPELVFGRPEEFVSATIFLVALIGYLSSGEWKKNSLVQWLILSLTIGFFAQALFMPFSFKLFDWMFDAAHMLKLASYVVVLAGLYIDISDTYKASEKSGQKIDRDAFETQKITAEFRAIFENMVDGLITMDDRGTIVSFNPAAEQHFGYRAEEVIGQNFKMLMPEPDRGEHDVRLSNPADSGIKEIVGIGREVTGLHKDGSVFPIDLSVSESEFQDEMIYTGIVRDLSERKRSEDAIRLRDASLLSSQSAMIIIDLDGIITFANPAFMKMWGFADRLSILGKSLTDFFYEWQDMENALSKTIQEGEWGGKLFARKLDGTPILVLGTSSKVVISDGEVAAMTFSFTDITQSKQYEEALVTAREKAERADRAKSTFLANMSHELRTPLNAIIGYSEMLEEDAREQGLDDMASDLQKIHGSGKNLVALINDILDISKIEAGRMDLFLDNFEPVDLIHEVESTILPLAEKNGNTFSIYQITDLGNAHGDQTKVSQVLYNLLSNACKFTKDGQITLTAERVLLDGIYFFRFVVSDTGIGIRPEDLGKLFRSFFQADETTTRNYGGTGLGLVLSKQFCEMMGGRISVQSQPGEGSVFTVEIPVDLRITGTRPSQFTSREVEATIPAEPVGDVQQYNVLVIDDDPVARELLSRDIASIGIGVITASDGETGLRLAREYQPVAITLDVIMPGMNGWEVLAQLKADPELEHIPVIMTTIFENKKIGFSLGASEYLIKPIDRQHLQSIMERYKPENEKRSVLIVDDDEDLWAFYKSTLALAGWDAYLAENGLRALEMLEQTIPDVVILDLMMPEMDGFEVAAKLRNREEWRSIPVIVLTGKDLTQEERNELNGGIEAFLAKGDEGIADTLRSVIERTRGGIR